jgi:hypothetical protein
MSDKKNSETHPKEEEIIELQWEDIEDDVHLEKKKPPKKSN